MNLRTSQLALMSAIGLAMTTSALAASFASPNNLVVMNCTGGTGAEKVSLSEYDVSGATPVLVQTIDLPFLGASAFTTPGLMNHDRHMHRSADGRYLSLVGYNADFGSPDPSLNSAATTPRVVGLVRADGSYDLSTRLTDAYNNTTIRSATTTDGVKFWLGGDNAGGVTPSGGTRYTTLGSNTTVDISQVQVTGGPQTPDNIRDAAVFSGQLYNSSGSSSSVGKAVFSVGTGLPESGAQTLTKLTLDNQSVTSFYFLDADPGVPGLDTLYTAAGASLRKFNLVSGTWTAKGLIGGFSEVEQITARIDSGIVTLFAGQSGNLYRLSDATPYGGSLSGSVSGVTPYLSAAAGFTLGGLDFAPIPEPATVLLVLAGAAFIRRRS